MKTTQFTYDAVGNRTSVTDPEEHTTYFTYDALNRLTATIDPLGNATYFTYDKVGNVTSKTDGRAATTYYTYDALSRQTRIDYPALAGQSAYSAYYSYDAAGNLLHMQDPHTLTYYQYDALQRMTEVQDALLDKAVYYQYDAGGNRTAMVDPEEVAVYYQYDAGRRLTEVTREGTVLGTYVYTSGGRRARLEYGNGATAYYEYDAAGRLTSLSTRKSDDTIVSSFDYTYDKAGNRTSMALASGDCVSYVYDPTNQLTAEVRRDSGEELVYANYFSYDKAGNRTELHRLEAGVNRWTYYTYDAADELLNETADGSTTYYSYDAAGNTTRKDDGAEVCYYSYDADNLMVGYRDASSSAYYRYDARPDLRRRAATEVNAATTYFSYDNMDCIAEYDGALSHQRSYVTPSLDDNLALISSSSLYYYTKDGLGSIRELLDTVQVLKNVYDYEAFGSQHGTPTEDVTQPFRFTARTWEPTLSLLFYRARMMAPSLGRFLLRDPDPFPSAATATSHAGPAFWALWARIHRSGDGRAAAARVPPAMSQPSGANLYVYASNSPVLRHDPSGRWDRRVHYTRTFAWAKDEGFSPVCARIIAGADNAVDTGATAPRLGGDFSYHFDYGLWGQALYPNRGERVLQHWTNARSICTRVPQEYRVALRELGTALHPLQDMLSHREGGHSSQDRAGHLASTPMRHIGYAGHMAAGAIVGSPYISVAATCTLPTRVNNPGCGGDWHRPDELKHFSGDVWQVEKDTKRYLRRFIELRCAQCYCVEKGKP